MDENTDVQSPGFGCRNRTAEGYQGLSSRERNQRHSGLCRKAIHKGRPMAPAKCGTDVSLLITRSQTCMMAAVSRNVPGSASKSGPGVSTGKLTDANWPAPSPFCSEINRTPGTAAIAEKAMRGIERPASLLTRAPCQAIPILTPPSPRWARHRCTRAGSALKYGMGAGIDPTLSPKASGRLAIGM